MSETSPALRDRIKDFRPAVIAKLRGYRFGNPKAPTEQDVDILDNSLKVNGYVSPVVTWEPEPDVLEILDGHTRVDRILMGYPGTKEIKVIVLDCESAEEGRAIILGMKNSAAWDFDELDDWARDAMKNGLSVDAMIGLTGLTAADLESIAEAGQKLLDDATTELDDDPKPDTQPDSKPGGATLIHEVDIPDELPKKTVTRPGDIWVLGDHRLVCGDMTVPEVVAATMAGRAPDLLWTDPPWNIALDAGNKPTGRSSTRKERTTIKNDALGKDFPEFAARFSTAFATICPPGTPIYVAMSTDEWGLLHDTLKRSGFHWSSTIIWSKNSLILSRKDFHPQYEPIWYGWRDGAARKCAPSDRAVSDVWPFERPRKSDLHPTMKPIALVARSINSSSNYGDLVLDTFGGSGTTMLAAEQMGRRAALVELDPAYCDIIVERWQKLTGRKAKRTTV